MDNVNVNTSTHELKEAPLPSIGENSFDIKGFSKLNISENYLELYNEMKKIEIRHENKNRQTETNTSVNVIRSNNGRTQFQRDLVENDAFRKCLKRWAKYPMGQTYTEALFGCQNENHRYL